MNEKLFEEIRNQKLTKNNVDKKVRNWSDEKITRFIKTCEDKVLSEKPPSGSRFSFVASDNLSGGIHPCAKYDCRLSSIKSLATFSSLYSDRVLIQNLFSKYGHQDATKTFGYKNYLIGDLMVLLEIEPLAKENLLGMGANSANLCSDCFKKTIGDKEEIKKKKNKALKLLDSRYLSKTKLTYDEVNSIPAVILSGPDEIIEHSAQVYVINTKSPMIKTLRKYSPKGEIKKRKLKEYFFHAYFEPYFEDLFIQDFYSNVFNYNSVTHQTNDLFLRYNLEEKKNNIRISQILKNLKQVVPSVENVELKNLVKLRNKEYESLKVYRDSVDNLLNKIEKGTSEEDINEIIRSEINTEVNKLDSVFKNNKKKFANSFMRKSIIGTAFISVGMFSGLVPPNVGQALATIGGYNFVNALSKDAFNMFKPPKEVENNNYYFVWKLKKISR